MLARIRAVKARIARKVQTQDGEFTQAMTIERKNREQEAKKKNEAKRQAEQARKRAEKAAKRDGQNPDGQRRSSLGTKNLGFHRVVSILTRRGLSSDKRG